MTVQQLLELLDANCGGLHPSKLVNLPTEMMGYYANAEGIPEYINILEDAPRKLAGANLPMLDDQLLAIASTAVLASKHFPVPPTNGKHCHATTKLGRHGKHTTMRPTLHVSDNSWYRVNRLEAAMWHMQS